MGTDALIPLLAVIIGGLLSIAGGIVTTTLLEKQKQRRESRNLALAFKGEIGALLEHIEERGYLQRFADVIAMMEDSGEPFYMPLRFRYEYDRVYESNVHQIGTLNDPLPRQIPLFYTRLISVMEDLSSIGDGTYARLDIQTLLRVHRDMLRILERTFQLGKEIVDEIERQYETTTPGKRGS